MIASAQCAVRRTKRTMEPATTSADPGRRLTNPATGATAQTFEPLTETQLDVRS